VPRAINENEYEYEYEYLFTLYQVDGLCLRGTIRNVILHEIQAYINFETATFDF